MNEKIKQHLVAYAEKNGWKTDDAELIEILTEAPVVFEQKLSASRWWNNMFIVTEVEGMFIGYNYAQANRDESVQDLGWEFDKKTICEVKPVEKVVTVYEKI